MKGDLKTMGATLVYRPGTDIIAGIKLTNVMFSYAYLLQPRPKNDLKAGTFGADLLIDRKDTEALTLLEEYMQSAIEEGKETAWNNKLPKNLNFPWREGDAEKNSIEEGMLVLKTTTKRQPQLFIREEDDNSPRAFSSDEEAESELYSGMIGEAFVTLRPFTFQNTNNGVTAYLGAVCKTAKGTPIGAKTDYQDVFSVLPSTTLFPAPGAKAEKPSVKAPVEVKEEPVSTAGLLSGLPPKKKVAAAAAPAEPEVAEGFSLASLIKNQK